MIMAFLKWTPKLKEAFFDRKAVMNAIDKQSHDALFWFGGRVREKTRQYIGKPSIEGSTRVSKKTGKQSIVKRRKVRAAGKPPIARVNDSTDFTIRNIQFMADKEKSSVVIFSPKFGSNAAEHQEFGGTVKVRAKLVSQRTKTGRVKKKKGQVQRHLVFSKKYPQVAFSVPARPFLGPTFDKVVKQFIKRYAKRKLR